MSVLTDTVYIKKHSRLFSVLFVFVVFFAFCAPALRSQEITSIEVTGLKRTKPHIARYPLEKFLGREASTLDLNEVQAAVINTSILEPLSVELVESGDGMVLSVSVHEKWSLFPAPLVLAGSGEANFGLFLLDSNAFGLLDMAVLGGMYGTLGLMAVVMYNHTPNRKGLPGWNSFFMYGRQNVTDTDRDENVYRRYSTDQFRFSFGMNFPFAEYFSGSASVSFTNISLRNTDDILNPPESGAMHLGFSPGLSLRSSSWDGFLLSQRSLYLGYSYNLGLAGSSSWHQTEFRGVLEQPIVPGFRFNLRSAGVWKSDMDDGTAPLFEDGPGSAQVDILPRKFSARHYAGFSAGLEKYLLKINWGTLSALFSWQGVFSNGPISGFEFDHGPSGGIRFYLSRLALPALGTGIAYNMSSKRFQFAFYIGMEF